MQRIVQPEILDSLHPNDPDAIASRRDLRLINKIMGNEKWIAKKLFSSLKPNDRILEIGAGSGDLGRFLQKKSSQKPLDYCGLDLAPRPADLPADWQWFQDDLTKFNRFGDFTILLANLILHHFENDDLAELGKKIGHSDLRLIVACEPARFPLHRWQLHLLRPFKLNRVTLHDGVFVPVFAPTSCRNFSVYENLIGSRRPAAPSWARCRWSRGETKNLQDETDSDLRRRTCGIDARNSSSASGGPGQSDGSGTISAPPRLRRIYQRLWPTDFAKNRSRKHPCERGDQSLNSLADRKSV